MAPKEMTLPPSVVSRIDAARLNRELESMDDFFDQQKHNQNKTVAPVPSLSLQEAIQTNGLDLTSADDRSHLQQFLKDVKAKAPTIHMSFATDPPSTFTTKIVNWLRQEVHPSLLLEIGLQPSIAAGCIIRTNNRVFDCSVRQHLLESKPKLIDMLKVAKHV